MRKVKSFNCGPFNIECVIHELTKCTNPDGVVVDFDQVNKAKELGFDTSTFKFEPSFEYHLTFGYSSTIRFTIDQIIAFRDLIEGIIATGTVSSITYEALKHLPNIKFVPVIRLLQDLDVTLPNGASITVTTGLVGEPFLSLLPDEYIVKEYKVLKFYNAKFAGDSTGFTVMTRFGDTSKLIDFFDRIITYYKEMLTSKDNGGLGIDALESEPTQTP